MMLIFSSVQMLFAQESDFDEAPRELQENDSTTKAETKSEIRVATSPQNSALTQSQIDKMSSEQKVGQLLILGFSGIDLRPHVKKTVDLLRPGAVILFKHNIKSLSQTAALNFSLQDYTRKRTGLPLFIMVDQEGGAVARIKTQPPLPTALAMGNSGNTDLVRDLGQHMGGLMRTLGFNMNLAPVLDIGDPARKSFIGNRAFSGQPEVVGEMAMAFSQGLSQAGVMPTAKHFPGHGGLSQDSHKKTPSKLLNMDELESTDLVPFKTYATLQAPSAVMVAHVAYPNIDPSGLPAAFSGIMIREVLREKLGYQGLVITDDIEMLGADMAGDIEERAIKAIEAGCDMVMIAWSPQRQLRAYRGILKAVKSGRISQARLNESVSRILNAKNQISSEANRTKPLFTKQLRTQMSALGLVTKRISRANFKQGSAALTPSPAPLAQEQKLAIFSSDPAFYSQFLAAKPKNKSKFLKLTPKSLSSVEGYLKSNPEWFGIYFASGSITAKKINSFAREIKQRMIVVNGAYPGAIENRDQFKMVLDVNTPDPETARWLAENYIEGTVKQPEATPNDIRVPSSEDDIQSNE